MTSPIVPCAIYFVYAAAYVVFALMFQVDYSSEIFFSVAHRFEKPMKEVRGGPQVLDWLLEAFLPQLFAADPVEQIEDGFCTEKYPCLVGEGNAHDDSECARYLTKGFDNCPSYMGYAGCCEPCQGATCANVTVALKGNWQTGNTSVANLAQACETVMPSWLPLLDGWPHSAAHSSIPAAPSKVDFKFCPERLARLPREGALPKAARTLTIAGFNQVLAGRLTMKRIKLTASESPQFKTAYPHYQSAPSIAAFTQTSGDNQEPFGTAHAYSYSKDGGFLGAGGFVHFFDFSKSQTAIKRELDVLQHEHWFDLNQGSFALEMLFFNGNYEIFMHVTFVFEHDFVGETTHYILAQPLNMSFMNAGSGFSFVLRYFALLIMVIGFLFFVKSEMDDMSADPVAYFTNLMQLIHFFSLILSLACVLMWCMLVYSYEYRHAYLPLSDITSVKMEQFDEIVDLAHLSKMFSDVLAINLCLIVVRCILLMADVAPFLSVIIRTIVTAKSDLFAFVMVFMILLIANTFAAYFLCGARIVEFNSFRASISTCLRIAMGESNYVNLDRGDAVLGVPFFFFFHLFFIIIKNVLLSVICLAYYKERKRVDDPAAADKYPLKRFIRQVRANFRSWSRVVGQCLGTLWQFLFGSGSGSAIRVNAELVNGYRDRRSSYRPKYRTVQYEAKQDEFAGDVRMPHEDIRLRWKKPFYPTGMMNYYVDWVAIDGSCGEAGVKENYRLVAIQQQGEPDSRRFRDEAIFRGELGKDFADTRLKGFNMDVGKMLEFPADHPPITLEFEGWVEPVSKECLGNLIFVIILALFLGNSMRITDGFYLTEVQKMALFKPHWFAYNPTRMQNVSTLEGLHEMPSWFDEVVLENHFGCIVDAQNPGECWYDHHNKQDYARNDWTLYAGVNGISGAGPEGGMGFTPPSAQGLSVGYVPWSGSRGGDPNWKSKFISVPRQYHWNVGFMANNFVRNTIQVACFEESKDQRWANGYPYVLNSIIKGHSSGCHEQPCMKDMIQDVKDNGKACLDVNGRNRDAEVFKGPWSSLNYTYSKAGTFRELGGIAIGMGGSKIEAITVSNIMHKDQMLTGSFVNSFVMEYVTYNEHLDLFSYNMVAFSVLATGKMSREHKTIVFPMNVFSTGQQESQWGARTVNLALWILTLVCTLWFTLSFLFDLFIQYRITSELQRPKYSFVSSFFAESWWNVVDLVAVVLTITTQYFLIRYIMIGSSLVDWNLSSWTSKDFKFDLEVTEDRVDEFYYFSQAAFYFQEFTFYAAWSILFIVIRTVKFMVAIQQLRLVVLTIATAVWELLAMLLITLLALFGFACMFYLRFGVQFIRYGSVPKAFVELFLFMCGKFEIADLGHANPLFFSFVFPLVQLIFYFVLANMFLAVTVYKWREVRKSAQEDLMSTVKGCWKSLSCVKRAAVGESTHDNDQVPLDSGFWKNCAVLNYLSLFDDSGMIKLLDRKAPTSGKHAEAAADPDGHAKEHEEEAAQQLEQSPVRDLDKIFKKAHMEIASQMSRNIGERRQDGGGGLGAFLDKDVSEKVEEDAGSVRTIGIVDDQVEPGTAKKIKQDLEDKLKTDERSGATSVAQEIWLDALITVLEDVGTLKTVQAFFLPPAMIRPRTKQEMGKFDEKKVKMEQRLDKFLRLLIEGTKTQYYKYLKDSAKTKEKVLKQQSLVFADYLDRLEVRIKELQQEIKVLERKNTEMRSHVAPLL